MRVFSTFAIALAGALAFIWLALPLPWLLGPMASCLLAALLGVPMQSIPPLNTGMRTILGVAVGATFTPALLASMLGMWPTLLLVPVMIAATALLGVPYFQRLWGYDFPTAYYSAMPGGLQDMLIFGEEAGGNPRSLSLIHATRILVIVVTVPILLAVIWDADLTNPPGAPLISIAPKDGIVMVICGLVGWRLAVRVGMFGASILGPLLLAAIAALTGVLEARPPAEAINLAQFFIGMGIGRKYAGITVAELRRDFVAALGYCVILILLTLLFVEIIYWGGLAPPLEALLAFAPGGQAEMTVLALIIGAETGFVVAHHVLRMIVVIVGAPLAAMIFNR